MSEGYTKDHLNVLVALGTEIPKRPTMSTKEIVKAKFKGNESGDRTVRNAYRKLRDRGLIEIADKGQYRLTATGASMVKTVKEKGAEGILQERKPREKKETNKAPKKAVKAAPKKAAKPATKAAPAKKAAKPAPKKAAPVKAKPAVKAAPKKASALGQTRKTTTAKAATAPEKFADRPNGNGKSKSRLSAALPKKAEPKNDKPETTATESKPTLPM